jgi:NAD(P)-dependent dehydrogenase (short-subunit alcohol dehydrogenase family)
MHGKTVLITGTASGMGRIAARQLAAKGARLILVDFDVANGEQGRDEIMAETGNTAVEFIDCDVTSYAQVRNMTDHVQNNYSRLDVLINNAGITESVGRESVEGFEMTMATNLLGPFLITRLLLDLLKASAPSRIINVCSDAHKMVKTLDLEDIDNRHGWDGVNHSKGFQAYARSKLALVCCSYELAEKLQGSDVSVYALSPGYFIRTNVYRHMRGIWKLGVKLCWPFLQSPYRAAETYLYLATSPEVAAQTGRYWEHSTPKTSSDASHDHELRRRIWAYAERAAAR